MKYNNRTFLNLKIRPVFTFCTNYREVFVSSFETCKTLLVSPERFFFKVTSVFCECKYWNLFVNLLFLESVILNPRSSETLFVKFRNTRALSTNFHGNLSLFIRIILIFLPTRPLSGNLHDNLLGFVSRSKIYLSFLLYFSKAAVPVSEPPTAAPFFQNPELRAQNILQYFYFFSRAHTSPSKCLISILII